MLSWILIILAISLLFGVIKIEQLREWSKKILPAVNDLLNQIRQKAENLKNKKSKKD